MSERADFIPWDRPSPLLDALGDFRKHSVDGCVYGFAVDEAKLNARGMLHAGAISTLADVCIGHTLARQSDPPGPLVTVNLNTSFVAAASLGEWVDVVVRVQHVGRRVATGSAEFRSGERLLAHASAVFVRAGSPEAESPERA